MTKTEEELKTLKNEYNDLVSKLKELDEDELKQLTGGSEPEEFDWRTKGYPTPVKDQASKDESKWKFDPIGTPDGYYEK